MPRPNCRPLPPLSDEDIRRFWNHVSIQDPDVCWPWIGATNSGYGGLKIKRRIWTAHRLAYRIQKGADPFPLDVLHKCDNPICCNGSHFFLGTVLDNCADRTRKGRAPWGESAGPAKLTAQQVQEIRGLLKTGRSQQSIGDQFRVTQRTISCIKLGLTWRRLP